MPLKVVLYRLNRPCAPSLSSSLRSGEMPISDTLTTQCSLHGKIPHQMDSATSKPTHPPSTLGRDLVICTWSGGPACPDLIYHEEQVLRDWWRSITVDSSGCRSYRRTCASHRRWAGTGSIGRTTCHRTGWSCNRPRSITPQLSLVLVC